MLPTERIYQKTKPLQDSQQHAVKIAVSLVTKPDNLEQQSLSPLPTQIPPPTSLAGSQSASGITFIQEIGYCLEKKWLMRLSQRYTF